MKRSVARRPQIKSTLALQSVKGNLAQSLNVSARDTTTWSQVHFFLINCFNSAAPADTRGIYQFTSDTRHLSVHFRQEGGGQCFPRQERAKVKHQKDLKKEKGQKGSGGFSQKGKSKARGDHFQKDNRLLGHGVRIRIGLSDQQGQKGKNGKGKVTCQVW